MPLRIFKVTVQQLRKIGQDDSRHVNVEEQLAITLYFLENCPFDRAMQDIFQHYGETIRVRLAKTGVVTSVLITYVFRSSNNGVRQNGGFNITKRKVISGSGILR